MRGKIIALFAAIVVIVGALTYAISRAAVADATQVTGEVPRTLNAAIAQLQVEGLRLERWLGEQAVDPKLAEPFTTGTTAARGEAATAQANRIREKAAAAKDLLGLQPALVALVTDKGTILGREGSAIMRGDDLGKAYPHFKSALERGVPGSDVWVNKERNEQLLASFVPVRSKEGKVVGALVIGVNLNDERLTDAAEKTSTGQLAAAVKRPDGAVELVAVSSGMGEDVAGVLGEAVKAGADKALESGQAVDIGGVPSGYVARAKPLDGYGDGRTVVLVSVDRVGAPAALSALLWPTVGGVLVGLILVAVGGVLLGNYLHRPIQEIEDGLLAIINGRTEQRIELEHPEYGGLVFRINSLLNQLLGVPEDDTDDEGRPSHAPDSRRLQEALSVDERMAEAGAGGEDAAALRAEPEESYYARIFNEYISAKRSLGDPVDHITEGAFIARIKASEQEMGQKHGRPVRYKVEVQGKEVMLLAVPLS